VLLEEKKADIYGASAMAGGAVAKVSAHEAVTVPARRIHI